MWMTFQRSFYFLLFSAGFLRASWNGTLLTTYLVSGSRLWYYCLLYAIRRNISLFPCFLNTSIKIGGWAYVVVVVVLTLTRIIKSAVTGQAPVTLELKNTPRGKTQTTQGGTRMYHSWHNSCLHQKHINVKSGVSLRCARSRPVHTSHYSRLKKPNIPIAPRPWLSELVGKIWPHICSPLPPWDLVALGESVHE